MSGRYLADLGAFENVALLLNLLGVLILVYYLVVKPMRQGFMPKTYKGKRMYPIQGMVDKRYLKGYSPMHHRLGVSVQEASEGMLSSALIQQTGWGQKVNPKLTQQLMHDSGAINPAMLEQKARE